MRWNRNRLTNVKKCKKKSNSPIKPTDWLADQMCEVCAAASAKRAIGSRVYGCWCDTKQHEMQANFPNFRSRSVQIGKTFAHAKKVIRQKKSVWCVWCWSCAYSQQLRIENLPPLSTVHSEMRRSREIFAVCQSDKYQLQNGFSVRVRARLMDPFLVPTEPTTPQQWEHEGRAVWKKVFLLFSVRRKEFNSHIMTIIATRYEISRVLNIANRRARQTSYIKPVDGVVCTR